MGQSAILEIVPEDYVLTDQAAAMAGITRWGILKAIKTKRLTADKQGRDYLIHIDEVKRFAAERAGERRGRPRST